MPPTLGQERAGHLAEGVAVRHLVALKEFLALVERTEGPQLSGKGGGKTENDGLALSNCLFYQVRKYGTKGTTKGVSQNALTGEGLKPINVPYIGIQSMTSTKVFITGLRAGRSSSFLRCKSNISSIIPHQHGMAVAADAVLVISLPRGFLLGSQRTQSAVEVHFYFLRLLTLNTPYPT